MPDVVKSRRHLTRHGHLPTLMPLPERKALPCTIPLIFDVSNENKLSLRAFQEQHKAISVEKAACRLPWLQHGRRSPVAARAARLAWDSQGMTCGRMYWSSCLTRRRCWCSMQQACSSKERSRLGSNGNTRGPRGAGKTARLACFWRMPVPRAGGPGVIPLPPGEGEGEDGGEEMDRTYAGEKNLPL